MAASTLLAPERRDSASWHPHRSIRDQRPTVRIQECASAKDGDRTPVWRHLFTQCPQNTAGAVGDGGLTLSLAAGSRAMFVRMRVASLPFIVPSTKQHRALRRNHESSVSASMTPAWSTMVSAEAVDAISRRAAEIKKRRSMQRVLSDQSEGGRVCSCQ